MDLDTQATDKIRRAAQIEAEARDAVKKARNDCQLTLALLQADKDEIQHQLEEVRKHAAATDRALNDAVLKSKNPTMQRATNADDSVKNATKRYAKSNV